MSTFCLVCALLITGTDGMFSVVNSEPVVERESFGFDRDFTLMLDLRVDARRQVFDGSAMKRAQDNFRLTRNKLRARLRLNRDARRKIREFTRIR